MTETSPFVKRWEANWQRAPVDRESTPLIHPVQWLHPCAVSPCVHHLWLDTLWWKPPVKTNVNNVQDFAGYHGKRSSLGATKNQGLNRIISWSQIPHWSELAIFSQCMIWVKWAFLKVSFLFWGEGEKELFVFGKVSNFKAAPPLHLRFHQRNESNSRCR